jgi:hypothetical protein
VGVGGETDTIKSPYQSANELRGAAQTLATTQAKNERHDNGHVRQDIPNASCPEVQFLDSFVVIASIS